MNDPHHSEIKVVGLLWFIKRVAGAAVLIALVHAFGSRSVGQLVMSAWPAGAVCFVFISSVVFQHFECSWPG